MLRLGRRAVPGFGLGDFASAKTDLANQVQAVIGAGDTYYSADLAAFRLDYSDAVASYQAAGQAGANSVGPEIDAAGQPTITQPLTHQAWVLNAQLAALAKSGQPDPANQVTAAYFTRADADQAKTLATQIASLYTQAITAGQAAQTSGNVAPVQTSPAGPTSSNGAASSSSSSGGLAVGTALVAGVAGVLAWSYARKENRRHVRT